MSNRTLIVLTLVAALPAAAQAGIPRRHIATVMPPAPVPAAGLIAGNDDLAQWARSATPDIRVDVEPADHQHPVVRVSWDIHDHAAGHVLERAESLEGPYSEIATLPHGQKATTDRRLELTRRYFYRVVAVRGTVRSEPSQSVEVDVPAILAALDGQPEGLPHRPPPPASDSRSHDQDGTAAFLAFLLLRSAFKRRG